jgi:hypothetical protein
MRAPCRPRWSGPGRWRPSLEAELPAHVRPGPVPSLSNRVRGRGACSVGRQEEAGTRCPTWRMSTASSHPWRCSGSETYPQGCVDSPMLGLAEGLRYQAVVVATDRGARTGEVPGHARQSPLTGASVWRALDCHAVPFHVSAHSCGFATATLISVKETGPRRPLSATYFDCFEDDGRGDWTRTSDPILQSTTRRTL